MNEHKYKTEGSDCKPYKMVAMCSCGWSGKVVSGQGWHSQMEAKAQWFEHYVAHLEQEGAELLMTCLSSRVALNRINTRANYGQVVDNVWLSEITSAALKEVSDEA